MIKGWAAARNYPQPFERLSVDVDVAVQPESYRASEKFLSERNVVGVDLHEGLRRLDTMDWADLYAAAQTTKIGAASVRILRAEDHLRILCAHWLNDGGADKKRLLDVYYAVKNRPADFDWQRCLDGAGAKRRKWTVCTIGLAEKYLGLEIGDTPLARETIRLPVWLTKTVESEWKRNIRLKPLYICLNDANELLEQIKIRIPPNAVQATVEMEGEFDDGTRIPYQIGSVFARLKPSLERISRALWHARD